MKQAAPRGAACFLVRVKGFEPPASWSQTTRATNCATPGRRQKKLAAFRFRGFRKCHENFIPLLPSSSPNQRQALIWLKAEGKPVAFCFFLTESFAIIQHIHVVRKGKMTVSNLLSGAESALRFLFRRDTI